MQRTARTVTWFAFANRAKLVNWLKWHYRHLTAQPRRTRAWAPPFRHTAGRAPVAANVRRAKPMTKSEAASYLLKAEYSPTWRALEDILPHLEGQRYKFLPPGEYRLLHERNLAMAMEVYWREILHRAHWAASASLIRTHRWLSGLFSAFSEENLIVFCASLRGLLEACADTWYSLGPVAPTLASAKQTIEFALRQQLRMNVITEDIENRLIHFTFARKPRKGEDLPELHEAETISHYLSALEGEQPSLKRFYADLCDVVHPGARSIVSFSAPVDEQASEVVLTFSAEPKALAPFAVGFRILVPDLIAAGFNTGVLILRTLNALPAREVHTPFLASLNFKSLAAWAKIEKLLEESKAPDEC